MIQMDKKIKKPSLTKIQKQKPMNMTVTGAMFSATQIKQSKLPPLRPNLRKTTAKIHKPKQPVMQRKQTQTTFVQSSMFQSYYQTMNKGWVKPSDFVKQISQLNLMGEKEDDLENYEIKLSENVQKNMLKLQSLTELTQKWVNILRKVMFYTTSKKTTSQKLIQEIKFWKVLFKKFDELQYEFNDSRSQKLVELMQNCLKAKPEMKKLLSQFISLKDSVILTTPLVQKLYLSMQESLAGNIQKFEESSDIITSIQLLKKVLLKLKIIEDSHPLLNARIDIIYEKINSCLIEKLVAAPLYPRELANISGLKHKYKLIDTALSFYSNFLTIMEDGENEDLMDTIGEAQHTRNVLVNLLQILGYFEFLYKNKEVSEFSKLFSYPLQFNIYDKQNSDEWSQFMEKVENSMEKKGFQP